MRGGRVDWDPKRCQGDGFREKKMFGSGGFEEKSGAGSGALAESKAVSSHRTCSNRPGSDRTQTRILQKTPPKNRPIV
jgi:hypothetical protein